MFFSCGYRFSGGGNFPSGIHAVNVHIFENRTSETGVENLFTNDLIYEFTRSRKVVVTKSDKADAFFNGVIQSIEIRNISHKEEHAASERRVNVSLNLELLSHDGRIIWSEKGVTENEEYAVESSQAATEQNKQDAIMLLSKRLAEKIYNRLMDDF